MAMPQNQEDGAAASDAARRLAESIGVSAANNLAQRSEFEKQVAAAHENVVQMIQQQGAAEKQRAAWDKDAANAMDAAIELAKIETAKRKDEEERKQAQADLDQAVKLMQAQFDREKAREDPFENPEMMKAIEQLGELQAKQKEIEKEREKMKDDLDRVVEHLKDAPDLGKALAKTAEVPDAQADPELLRLLREQKKELLQRHVGDLDRVSAALQRTMDDKLVGEDALGELRALKARVDGADPTDRAVVGRLLSDVVQFGVKHGSDSFADEVLGRIGEREARAAGAGADTDADARRAAAEESNDADRRGKQPLVKLQELREQIALARHSGFGTDTEMDAQLASLEVEASTLKADDENGILRVMSEMIGITSVAVERTKDTGLAAADSTKAATEYEALTQGISNALDVTVRGVKVRDSETSLQKQLCELQKQALLIDESNLGAVRQLMAELMVIGAGTDAAAPPDAPEDAMLRSAAGASEFDALHETLMTKSKAAFDASTADAGTLEPPAEEQLRSIIGDAYGARVAPRELADLDTPLLPRQADAAAEKEALRTFVEVPGGTLAAVLVEMFIAYAGLDKHIILEVAGRTAAPRKGEDKAKKALATAKEVVTVTHVATNTIIASGQAVTACKTLASFYKDTAGFMYPAASPVLFPIVDDAYEAVRPLWGLAKAILAYRLDEDEAAGTGRGSVMARAMTLFSSGADAATADLWDLLSEYQRVLKALDKEYFATDKGTAMASQVPLLPDMLLFSSLAALAACGITPADMACHKAGYALSEACSSASHKDLVLHSSLAPDPSLSRAVQEWLESSMHTKARAKYAGF